MDMIYDPLRRKDVPLTPTHYAGVDQIKNFHRSQFLAQSQLHISSTTGIQHFSYAYFS